eukprot:TRINITY_DN1275_c0_g3_i1.p2 TRINITY_DN1275_c0_g3~~TRINITY_DN1275_c0_g3_i1.p2  ORF type:complete len:107 (+),score=24.14 TRINITY_DN1275_c0_g3_i1:1210-1530(+)
MNVNLSCALALCFCQAEYYRRATGVAPAPVSGQLVRLSFIVSHADRVKQELGSINASGVAIAPAMRCQAVGTHVIHIPHVDPPPPIDFDCLSVKREIYSEMGWALP